MGRMKRCAAGLHQFDTTKHSVCPYCTNRILAADMAGGDDERTQPTGGDEASTRGTGVNATRPMDGDKTRPIGSGGDSPDGAAHTRPMNAADEPPARAADPGATRVFKTAPDQRPVAGWLVVTDGVGRGASLTVYPGINSIGRARGQDIQLTFPDGEDADISREGQARLTYDPKGNTFYLQHGEGKNLTYLNDEPVLELKMLTAYDRITMGETTLVFVPFCGEQFQWTEA